ncbi:unnamed protein product, partial [marine sediment metagenome]
GFLKRFIKLSWHGIPIGIIASVLIGAAVLAATYITVTQTITQEITEPEPPPDYGGIVAPTMALPKLETGKSFTKVLPDGVVVTRKGYDVAFEMALTSDPLYTNFGVELILTGKPSGSDLVIGTGYAVSGGASVGVNLDIAGTYTFTETITGTAGSAPGTATSTVVFTLVTPYPEH